MLLILDMWITLAISRILEGIIPSPYHRAEILAQCFYEPRSL